MNTTSTDLDLMKAESEIFYSDIGEPPTTAIIALNKHPNKNTKIGCDRVVELLNAIDPEPHVNIHICLGIQGPDGKQYDTTEDTVILLLFYTEKKTRVLDLNFNCNRVTLH